MARQILQEQPRGTNRLELNQFKDLYRAIESVSRQEKRSLDKTTVVLLSEGALVRLSVAPNYIIRVNKRDGNLRKKDFDFLLAPRFEGNVTPIPLRAFVWTEIRRNWYILIPLGVMLVLLLLGDTKFETLNSVNQMLVDANAIFISIFVLFTVSQNTEILRSKHMLQSGETFRLMQNDRYITGMAILSLVMAIISTASSSSSLPNSVFMTRRIFSSVSSLTVFLPVVLTTIASILLVDCLLSISTYYLKIHRSTLDAHAYRILLSGGDNQEDDDN